MQAEDYNLDWTGRIVSSRFQTKKRYAIVLEDKQKAFGFYCYSKPSQYAKYHLVKILWLKQKGENDHKICEKIETKVKKYLILEK